MALSMEDLRSFILVANERSVTGAAGKLGVTQQSVSERIRRLEGRLGVQLFERLAYGMQPTPAGYRFLPYATECMSLLDQALAVIDDDDLVRVKVQSSVSSAVMGFLENITSSTTAKVSVTDDSEKVIEAIAEGGLDVAVGVFSDQGLPPPPARPRRRRSRRSVEAVDESADSSDQSGAGDAAGDAGAEESSSASDPNLSEVVVEPLFSDPVVWAAPADHELVRRGTPLSFAELLSVPSNGGGSGIEVSSRAAIASELASGRLVELPVDQPGWVVPISIAYRNSDHDRPAVVAIRNAITEGHSLAMARISAARSSESGGADAAA